MLTVVVEDGVGASSFVKTILDSAVSSLDCFKNGNTLVPPVPRTTPVLGSTCFANPSSGKRRLTFADIEPFRIAGAVSNAVCG